MSETRKITNRLPEQFHPDHGETLGEENIITFFFAGGRIELRHKGEYLDIQARPEGFQGRLTISPYGVHSIEVRLET